ncbi:MAG: NAD(P)H-dependent glycerol-3-phosphate dehydrogenase [Desulforhabdus sp.]|jgi:glycerol-3-phosphate dehydrogenase (NAD(P)+)|nr:NAD(P)H-dependent glycerol-3-phosphate dehydrogenase [Desulforhabdus sp.]
MVDYAASGIALIGAGAWGTTIGNLLASNGLTVGLWAKESHVMQDIADNRFNDTYLPGIKLSDNLRPIPDSRELLADARLVILGIPIQYLRHNLRKFQGCVHPDATLLNLGKGIESSTHRRASEIIREELGGSHRVACLSGPNIASEVARNHPGKAVISASDHKCLEELATLFTTPNFHLECNADLIGVELGGALKNVIALGAGIGDGLGFGVNTRSVTVCQGFAEMAMIAEKLGASPRTLYGLAGLGDLLTTCFSPESRNRRFGEGVGKGLSIEEAAHSLSGRVAEGVETTKSAYQLAQSMGLRCPIVEALYGILHCGENPRLLIEVFDTRQEARRDYQTS